MATVSEVGELLIQKQQTITSAESLTAGLFASTLAEVSGISAALKGAFVTYSPEMKEALIGVPHILIQRHGVVSAQVAEAMARGAKYQTKADWAVSFTGVAGPDELEGQPAGTVFIAIIDDHDEVHIAQGHFAGNRQVVRQRSVQHALDELTNLLSKN